MAALAVSLVLPGPAFAQPAETPRLEMFYSVAAHPDDEGSGWAMVAHRPQTYVVMVTVTQGERTAFCKTAEESRPTRDPEAANGTIVEGLSEADGEGPFGYQGPDSPVEEPDKGERHPLGNPWKGKGSRACKNARIASWHWFLDEMALTDGGLPDMGVASDPEDDDSYEGRFCDTGVGCAKVWTTEEGARVAFDLGDRGFPYEDNPDPMTSDDVTAALRALRANRAKWGLPALPERGVLANTYYYTGTAVPLCANVDHPDHEAVLKAIYETDQHAGPQFGAACRADARYQAHPGPALAQNPATMVRAMLINPLTEERIGPYVRNYGWLYGTYTFDTAPQNVYWMRSFSGPGATGVAR